MSMYFDIPLFELPSLAGRLSNNLILGVEYVCGRDFWKGVLLFYPRKKTCISMFDCVMLNV